MEIDPVIFWNVVLTLIIAPAVWAFRNMMAEVKRIDILLNRTREDYASRAEVKDEMQHVMEALHRLEDKFCLLYTSPSPRDATLSRMPSSA